VESNFLLWRKEKVHFWPSNFCLGLVLAIELQNQITLIIQLLNHSQLAIRRFWWVVLTFFIYNLVLRTWNDYTFFLVAPI
jgi:hypothetical protein